MEPRSGRRFSGALPTVQMKDWDFVTVPKIPVFISPKMNVDFSNEERLRSELLSGLTQSAFYTQNGNKHFDCCDHIFDRDAETAMRMSK